MSLILRTVSPGKEALVQAMFSVCGTLAVHFLAALRKDFKDFKDFKPVTEEILAPFHFMFKGWERALGECLPSM